MYVTSWDRAASFAPLEQSALVWLTAIAYDLARAARSARGDLLRPG